MIADFDAVPTLPRLLGGQGYVSFQAGKWWGGNYRHGGFTDGMSHGDPDRGGRHGDVGLTIGRETMQPVLDFIDRATETGKAVLRLVRADDAALAAHPARSAPREVPQGGPLARRSRSTGRCANGSTKPAAQLLDHLDTKGIADDTLVVYLADNGWIQDPDADRYAPRVEAVAVRRRPAYADRGALARQGAARSCRTGPSARSTWRRRSWPPPGSKPTPEMPGINLLDESAVEPPRGDLRRDLHAQCRRHPPSRLEPPLSLGGRGTTGS